MHLNRRTLLAGSAGAALLAAAGPRFARAADPLRIGIPTALTGPYGDLGEQARRAVTIAVDEANAAGGIDGRPVEVRFLDTQAKAEMARQQAEKLALSGFNIMAASIASGEVLAIAPMLERWDALYVATISKADDITGKSCNRRLFRVNHPDSADANVVTPWLATREEKDWAIMGSDTAWGRNSGASFAKAAAANGRTVVAEGYASLGNNDFAPYIQKIAESGAKGLWVALAGRDAVNFATQAKQFGLFDKVFTAGVSFATDNTVKTLGEVAKGVWGVINYSSTLDTPANRDFVARWAAKYPGTAPTNFEGETYVGMQVIFQAVKTAGSVKPADVAAAMEGATFDTLFGQQLMRKEDHQLVVPNYFGVVKEHEGVLKPVITMTVPADQAMPAPNAECKLST
ncbi:ABC transporter substrate-binding protein [Zavarzinia compransoris]|nr:ABC transporter substrate-binding protein [Zavarzinia compransoris]TDP44034.1 amino acid/amide ABC transporter substrate-binding protein (HAAT family) [Zavarzinia compransoris]